jgi:hypothetical protein
MWSIAQTRLGSSATNAQIVSLWPKYYAQNSAVIGGDPNLLRPGEVLHLSG